MKKFIQKITSIFISLTMFALIGAPAYAASADSKPNIIESVLPDIANEKSTLAVDVQAENNDETEISPVCNHDEEEIDVEESETEEENDTENTENADIAATQSDPVISEEEILDFIESEEVQGALEDAGIDSEAVEEEFENGEIFVTDDPEELTYKDKVLLILDDSKWAFLYSGICVVFGSILNPVAWIFPPLGAALLVAGLPLGVVLAIAGIGKIITSPIAALFPYDN